jgi:hypothetical protein
MYLAEDLEPPIILFAGRPIVSAKGLATLADALRLLEELPGLPVYSVWLVGGNEAERAFLRQFSSWHPGLRRLQREGRCVAWGHVEGNSLAEIYSRGRVLVMPSLYEPFGLVAVEAMACGCPVIATRTGGFQDTVVPGLTGELVPVDSPQALANTLTGFLRSPQKAAWQGENGEVWTRRRFDASVAYDRLYEVVTRGIDPGHSLTMEPVDQWRSFAIEEAVPAFESLLAQAVENFDNQSGRSQTGARFTVGGIPLHAKIIAPRPPRLTTIFPLPSRLNPPTRPAEIVARYRVIDAAGLTPRLVASCDKRGLLVTEWCEPVPDVTLAVGMELMREFREFGVELADPSALDRYVDALFALAERGDEAALGDLDDASAEVNASLTGGVSRFHRTQPQAELLRILLHVRHRTWALPPDLSARVEGVAETILQACPFVVARPELNHGSLKPMHVLQGTSRLVTCDLDNALFAVGPMDLIHWLYSDGRLFEHTLPFALADLRRLVPGQRDFVLAAAWLLVFVLHHLLDQTVKGDPERAGKYARYLAGFPEAVFRSGLTRSPIPGDGYGPA